MIRARSTSRTVAVARLTRTTSTERSASGSTAGSDIPMSTDGAAPTPAPQAYRELQTPSTRPGSGQSARLDDGLDGHVVGTPLDPVGRLVRPVSDRFHHVRPAVDQPHAVVGGVTRRQDPPGEEPVRERTALILGVVVHTVGGGDQAEPVGDRAELGPVGVGCPADVPAQRARGHTAEHHPGAPGLGEHPAPSPPPAPRPWPSPSPGRGPRHTASRLATLPPPTQMTSCVRRWERT